MKNKKSIGLIISLSILCIISTGLTQNFVFYIKSSFWIHPEQEKIVEVHSDYHTNIMWLNYSMDPDFNLYIYRANEANYLIDNWELIGTVNEDCGLWEMSGLDPDETYYLKFKNVDTISSYMEVYIFVEESEPEPEPSKQMMIVLPIIIISLITVAIIVPVVIVLVRRHKRKIPKEPIMV